MRVFSASLAAVALALCGAPALAQDAEPAAAPESPFKISGNATIVSDYRFRGISLSDEDPAAQATLNINHASGFYVGAFASTLDDADGASAFGTSEVDLYAGYTKEIAPGTTIDGGLLYYYYADSLRDTATDYFEPYASIAHTIGPVTAKAGAAYAWKQDATADDDWLYLYGQATVAVPTTPFSVVGRVGHQDLGPLEYWEYQIGVSATVQAFTVGVSYVDTDQGDLPNVDAGVVFSLGVSF